MNELNNFLMALIGLTIVIAAVGWSIVAALNNVRNAIIALISLSAKKGTLPPVDWSKMGATAPGAQVIPNSTHIHFPKSMFPSE